MSFEDLRVAHIAGDVGLRSELVRDAIRHLLAESRLSRRTLEDDRISREQIESGDVVALEDQ